MSDSSVSSSEDYKPVAPPEKKKKSHEDVYKTIYGSSTDNSDHSNDVHAESSNDKHEGPENDGSENEEPENEEQVTSAPLFDAESPENIRQL